MLRRAIRAYNDRNEDGVSQDAPERFLERIIVNYIPNDLTTYDCVLAEVAGRVGIADAVQAIRRRIYVAITPSDDAVLSI